MTTTITLPDPLRFYLADEKRARAILEVAEKDTAPDDLEIGEFPDFVRARLTAQTVQAHYVLFLHDLWQRTWGMALEEHGITRFPDWQDNWFKVGIDEAWEYGMFRTDVAIGGKTVTLAVYLPGAPGPTFQTLQIGLYESNGKEEWHNALVLVHPWLEKPDEGARVTDPELLHVQANAETVDVTPLLEAARHALTVIAPKC